ncbi:MAG TPA: DNA replication/repair protein RecF [Rhodanobacteraceae bacterium]|nr:DNA replication/repair protein RecF [Rhodanobacteraceae bacterium]
MHLRRLKISGIRLLQSVALEPGAGFNLLIGANGAGKTSVLEAMYLLSRGRSFRGGGEEALLRRGANSFEIFAEVGNASGGSHRVGLGRRSGRWECRLDGTVCSGLGELLRHFAMVCFEPGSHELLAGGAQIRRRFLDWGVFHVEQSYLDTWRRYQRALKQRNQLLRTGAREVDLLPWEQELDVLGTAIHSLRMAYLRSFERCVQADATYLLPELGALQVSCRQGWPDGVPLRDALAASRERDLARGHTGVGPHRADWRLVFEQAPEHLHLSRGQEKLAALACLFAQTAVYVECSGDWPVIGLDDLASELDGAHLERVIARLRRCESQIWITGTEKPSQLTGESSVMFHVEHGGITQA